MGLTRREWESRHGDNPDTVFEDRPTYVIVRDPTNSPQGERNDQYFAGFKRHWAVDINGEYEPYGPAYLNWSSSWEDAITYETLRSAEKSLTRIVGKTEPSFAAVVGPS